MAINDLTPQLRTRLGRLEKLVGWFVTLASLLMLAGLGYYVYHTANRKGWFKIKAPYFTYLHSANGLRVGDPIKLMGWDVGEITRVTFEDPGTEFDVYVEFVVREPFYGYVWNDSVVKVRGGLFGNRYLELTKGGTLQKTNLFATYKDNKRRLTDIYNRQGGYTNYVAEHSRYWLQTDEPPDLAVQMDQVAQAVRDAIPNLLAITNRVNEVLSNSVEATSHLVALLDTARPSVTNLLAITTHLRDPKGALGEWLLPTNVTPQLTQTLASATLALQSARTTIESANVMVTNTDARLELLVSNLNLTLENLAGITSNLHAQANANTNLVTGINNAIVHSDEFVQGLKRHWLLRSAFKTNKPPATNRPPQEPSLWRR